MRKIRERRADSTADTYDHCLLKQVLPQLGELRLHECDVAQIDAFFTRLERARRPVENPDGTTTEKPAYAANTRGQIRAIVSGLLQQAVLHKAISTNPVRELERIESPKGHRTAPPRGLTPEERRRLLAYVDTNKAAIRADPPDLVRFALGSGLRIGEICAVRWMDLDLDDTPIASLPASGMVPLRISAPVLRGTHSYRVEIEERHTEMDFYISANGQRIQQLKTSGKTYLSCVAKFTG